MISSSTYLTQKIHIVHTRVHNTAVVSLLSTKSNEKLSYFSLEKQCKEMLSSLAF